MKNKIFLLGFVGLLLLSCSSPESPAPRDGFLTIQIQGKVMDVFTHLPLQGAKVALKIPGKGTIALVYTDEGGNFFIKRAIAECDALQIYASMECYVEGYYDSEDENGPCCCDSLQSIEFELRPV